ncbi:Hypothetical predicted protein [Octopus vulgaris]|uniref:Uncharacterized protein n=1 Tax=Octopus vulgaris TaxID=6645 RepID=A0AA36B6Q5_OCTVU|nr:Hypothetical predicted protein [Octopus vulgaris]
MEEGMQQEAENEEELITEISEGEEEVQSDKEIAEKSQEAYDKGVQKKGGELQSDGDTGKQECEEIQTDELQWRGILEQQGNGI